MRRALLIGAGLALALVVITCTDERVTGPARPGHFALDLHSLLAAPAGLPDLPLDSARITLRRPSETAFAYDKTFPVRGDTSGGDSLVLAVTVDLQQNTEDFVFDVTIYATGIASFTVSGTVRLTAGSTVTPAPFLARYIGPGANALRVQILPPDTTVLGGTVATLRGVVFDSANLVIPNAPVGFRLGDATHGVLVPGKGLTTALFTAPVALRDSVWVIAETPTHLKDSTRIHVTPPAATLQKVAGDLQSGVIGVPLLQPLVVRVRDALGAPFKGQTVTWSVVAGSAVLSLPTTVSDDSGLASIIATPSALGGITVQAAAGVLSGSPVTFTVTALSGAIRQVVISPRVDTIARGATAQYSAVLKDSLGNTVSGSVTWNSSLPSIATVNGSGMAAGVAGDSTLIIAAAGGRADTARLYVRALRTVTLAPGDTVVTAVDDSFLLSSLARDNFGAVVSSGFTTRYITASPTVAGVNAANGRVTAVGAGNGVLVVRDSVDPLLVVQGSATLHVNQRVAQIVNNPNDSIQVGVNGRGQIVATAHDRNHFPIPGRTFGWLTRDPAVASVDQTGVVIGLAVGVKTYAVDSLVDSGTVYKDSTLISVVSAPPPRIQWALDTLAIGNGGNVSLALSLNSTSAVPVTIRVISKDTAVVKPSQALVNIPAGQASASVILNGLGATISADTVIAQDSAGVYAPDTLYVIVVSTIQFQEVGAFYQQPDFYVNQNETHRAQVFLSDPAPPGGLGITFVYGRAGTSAINPAPAIIPAGQLRADVVIQGLAPGTDSVVPTSGGFVGRFSRVHVAPNSLTINRAYPYTGVLGVGQAFQPSVSIPNSMDHTLAVVATLSAPIGTVQNPDTITSGNYSRSFTVTATTPGRTILTVSAPGWVGATDTLTFTVPQLQATGSTSLVAGDPTKGSWIGYTQDSLRAGHEVTASLLITAHSRDTNIVAVDVKTLTIATGSSSGGVGNALRAQPAAGGDSTWIVLTAPGYVSDSFLVRVTRPTLTLAIGYPYTGRVGLGTIYQTAGYVQIPYARLDTFTVALGHSRPGVVRGPATVRILPNQTTAYFNLVGDTLGIDTLSIASAPGYLVAGGSLLYQVDSLHVRPYSYPGATNYTITPPAPVTVYAYDPADGQSRPLVKALRVSLASSNVGTFTLDSAQVTIDSGQTYSFNHIDTLRFGVDTVGARILSSAPGSSPDSSNLIRVYQTPLALQLGYPYTLGRGLRLPGSYAYIVGGNAPDTIHVAIRRNDPTLDSLTRDTVLILKGQNSSAPFTIVALDSNRTDTITATAPGYVIAKLAITTQAASLVQGGLPGTRLTTDPPYQTFVYTAARNRTGLEPATPVSVTVVSSDPRYLVIDSAGVSVNGTGDTAVTLVDTARTYGAVRVRFAGSGSARLRFSAPGFASDSTGLVAVTGPALHLTTGAQNLGVGQLITGQYVYVDNPVTGSPLVVQLLRSDTLAPAPAFSLSATSVTIPVGQTSSSLFEIQGASVGSAALTARAATTYGQAVATISVVQPKLTVSPKNVTLSVGQQPYTVYVLTQDQNGTSHIVANALTVGDTSAAPTVAQPDSLVLQLPARQASTTVGIRGVSKGATAIVFQAPGYRPDTLIAAVDTAQLTLNSPPNGLGPGQLAANVMYVSIPFGNNGPIVVNLTSDNPGVLSVPANVTIPAGQGYAYFNVTGVAVGTANVTATAGGVRPAAAIAVRVAPPKLRLFLSGATSAGQKASITVQASDSTGAGHNLVAPLTVTLVSTNSAHAAFDSATITIPAGGSSGSSGVTFDTAGSYVVTASTPGYADGVATTTTSGALVAISDFQFTPTTVTIQAGQYVTWKNNGPSAHTPTSDANLWSAGQVAVGQIGYVYFGAPGTFAYHCSIHPTMTATVIVQ